jgi:tRNA A-37 threonylcarbamoyl transferase component Bud32/tetratricopeptide (TPR) repeat protein
MSRDPLGLVGTLLERKYQVDAVVAEGGFSIVYRALHLTLAAPVALKVLRPSLRAERDALVDHVSQFRAEAALLSRLRSSGVVAVLDSGVTLLGQDPLWFPWLALEWLEGETLKDHLARRRGQGGRTPAECLDLLRPVLVTMAEAHELDIVHRDLKPSNIMLVPTRKGFVPRVLDFGIAKVMAPDRKRPASGHTATDSDTRAFSPVSAAPEQLSGARTGPWTDVYALGLLLTEVLLDRPPIGTTDRHELHRIAFARERPTPGAHGAPVGPWEEILTRALAVRPSDRPPDARALLRELEAALADSVAPAGRPRDAPPRKTRLRAVAAAATLGVALVAGVAARGLFGEPRDAPVIATGGRPLVVVADMRAAGNPGNADRTRRVAATVAELLAEQLRIGDTLRLPSAEERAAILAANPPDPNATSMAAPRLERLRSTAGADVVIGGELFDDERTLHANLEIYDAAHGKRLLVISLSAAANQVNALVREAGARVRRSLGRPALSAEDEIAVHSTLPEDPEASLVFVDGLSALRTFRYHDAAERFEETVRRAPRFAAGFAALAQARLKLGEQTRAREAADHAVELAGALPRREELMVLAVAAEARHDWGGAVERYRALAQFYPDRVDFVTALSRALVGSGKAPDATALLLEAEQRPQSDWDRMSLALAESYAYARQSLDDPSMDAARRAEELASRLGARVALAHALAEQANARHRAGAFDAAQALAERARAVYVEVEDEEGVLVCDALRVEVARAQGDFDRALALGESLVQAHRKMGNLYRVARETVGIGITYSMAGQLTKAREKCDEGGRMFVEAHDKEGEAFRYHNLADIDLDLGRLDGVAEKLKRAREIHAEIQHAEGVAQADGSLARLAWYEGRLADAEAGFEQAYAEASAAGEAEPLAETALDRARLAFERNSPLAQARFEDAERTVQAASDARVTALLGVFSARRALVRGPPGEARTLALAAVDRAHEAHAIDAIVLSLSVALEVCEGDCEALRAELLERLTELEAAEPAIVALLSLARSSRGAEAAGFAERAVRMAEEHKLVVLAATARRERARVHALYGALVGLSAR